MSAFVTTGIPSLQENKRRGQRMSTPSPPSVQSAADLPAVFPSHLCLRVSPPPMDAVCIQGRDAWSHGIDPFRYGIPGEFAPNCEAYDGLNLRARPESRSALLQWTVLRFRRIRTWPNEASLLISVPQTARLFLPGSP